VGVVPTVNLEWIQKLHRDKNQRGYSTEAVVDTILRRMPDYINYITPQFSRTHINFQRVPTVDTSNPFIARDIPTADESFVVIRFANPKGIDFPLPAVDDPRFLHVAAQHHRGARRQDGTGDATDLHAADPAPDRKQQAGLITVANQAPG
jgi:phosphoribulokinase